MSKPTNLQQEKRHRFLRNLIKEGILNVLVEQDMQQPQVSAAPPTVTPPAQQTNVMDPGTTPAAPATPEEGGEFTIDMMVDKLNVLRGAKSFTDPEIFGKMTTFFNELTEEQKTSFKWLLTELVEITDQAPTTPGIQNTVQSPQQGNQGQGTPQVAPAAAPPPQSAPAAPISAP